MDRKPRPNQLRRRGRWSLLLGACLMVAAVAAACSGSGAAPSGVATLPSSAASADPSAAPSASGDPAEAMLAYSQCMRDHGVAKFPDPVNGGLAINGDEVGLDTPTYKAADEACKSLIPPPPDPDSPRAQEQREQLLAYAQCMRENGMPNFPDPQPGGGITIGPEAGVDPDSPAFKTAETACASMTGAPAPVTQGQGGPGSSQP